MIPVYDVTPTVPSPLPTCEMPGRDDITEEGFGYFRGTWFIGRVRVRDAEETVRREAEVLAWLDEAAHDAEMFDRLATAIEHGDPGSVETATLTPQVRQGLNAPVPSPPEYDALDGLEVGVSGLSLALSAVGCLTAASCRSHAGPHSWSDCPVVFFAAPAWRVGILAGLIASERCGLDEDRDMLKIYAASVRDLHNLAERLLAERALFRRRPEHLRHPRNPPSRSDQLTLGDP